MTTIINYNLGNPKSIKNMLSYLGIDAVISDDLNTLKSADRLILPGVGHFAHGINQLNNLGFTDVIKEHALNAQRPILGICLGMQLMTKFSEEGDVDGLGLIDAQTKKFQLQDKSLKIPHMGWNNVSFSDPKHPLLTGMREEEYFYFVHSYFAPVGEYTLGACTYFSNDFSAIVAQENFMGCQFHPERSGPAGSQILENFSKL